MIPDPCPVSREGRRHMLLWAYAAPAAFFVATPAMAQGRDDDQPPTAAQPAQNVSAENRSGLIVNSAVGRAGQRQTRDQFQGIEPMARIGNRFANRVQNRISNRIGRQYSFGGSATSPFSVAADQVKSANPRSRR